MNFDHIVREWFYRLPKGYADAPYTTEELAILDEVLAENGVNLNEVDELDQAFLDAEPVEELYESADSVKITLADIKKLLDNPVVKLDNDDLIKIHRVIANSAFKEKTINYLISKNIAPENYSLGNNAVDIVFNKISSLPDVTDVIKYFDSPKDLTWKEDGRGNIKDITGLSDTSIGEMIKIQPGPDAGGSATGPAEIAFSLLFKNVKNATGGGDLELNGKTVELKGKGGRLGVQSGRGMELNLKSSFIGQMMKSGPNNDYTVEEDAADFFADAKNTNIAYAIYNAYHILVKKGQMPEDEFITEIQDGLTNIYFDKDEVVKKYFNNNTKWTDLKSIGRQLVKTNLDAYLTKIGNDIIIFHRFRDSGKTPSTDLSFIVVDKTEIDSVIDSGVITLGSSYPESSILWHNTNPSVKLNI
jgi:hypothetical protein